MSLRVPTQCVRTGTDRNAAFSAVDAAGDRFTNDGRTYVAFKNTAGAAVTVTFSFGVTPDGQAVVGKTCIVAATTGDVVTDTFPAEYNDGNGEVKWTYSTAPAGLTVAVFRVSKVSGAS